MDTKDRVQILQQKVSIWSGINFGGNTVLMPCGDSDASCEVMLNSLCPLMGMCEEIGELVEADTQEDIEDAIGDIGIFLLDYTGREGIDIVLVDIELRYIAPINGVIASIGRLQHVTLKAFQGIRGWDDVDKAQAEKTKVVHAMWTWLSLLAQDECDKSLVDVIEGTWESIVSKRDWTPATAAMVAGDQGMGLYAEKPEGCCGGGCCGNE